MIAEKCAAVFGRPIMLQVNGIDNGFDLDAIVLIQTVIVAAGL
jgi:hypothetical protein